MGKFVLASLKLSATGHEEDSYRYFELFLESIKGFPLISTTLDGFYQRYPTVHHSVRVFGSNGLPPDRRDELSPVLRWGHHSQSPYA